MTLPPLPPQRLMDLEAEATEQHGTTLPELVLAVFRAMKLSSFRRAGTACVLALGLSAPAHRAAADEGPLHALIAQQTAAWNQRDARAWARDFSHDADFINILGMHFSGRDEIEARHAYLFGGIFKESRLVVTVHKVRPLGESSAVVDTLHELQGYTRLPAGIRPTDGSGVLRTRMRYVVTQAGGRWQIVSAQNTAISPPP